MAGTRSRWCVSFSLIALIACDGKLAPVALSFYEANIAPAVVRAEGPRSSTLGGLITVGLLNDSTGTVVVSRILAAVSDPGLDVTYLGYTHCRRGCAGAVHWSPEMEQLAEAGVDGKSPIVLEPSSRATKLVFRLRVLGTDVVGTFKRHCPLVFRGLRVRLQDGRAFVIRNPASEFIGGLLVSSPIPKGVKCSDTTTLRR